LTNSWRRKGITPDFVVGHSSGEIAAAYAAAALTMPEAIIISYYRGLVTRFLDLEGGMAVVGMSANDVSHYLTPGIVIAAENSPNSTTISGDADKLDMVLQNLKTENTDILARRLQVDMAYHSREKDLNIALLKCG
jgi:acyl transferase domain-containing protein